MGTISKARLVGYIRVSTEAQIDGYGLEAQRQAIAAWAKAAGHVLAEVFSDEGVSGSTEAFDRDGLTSAIEAIESGSADGLVIARLDRLARALTVQEALLAHVWNKDGRVFTADAGEVLADDADDPVRTATRQLLGVFAQLDRAMITKRLRDGRRIKAERGGYVAGSPRYGWRAESGELVEDPIEQAVIARMMALRSSGSSLNAIASVLNAAGVPSKRGGIWRADSVSRVVDPDARESARRRVEVARRRTVA